MCYTIDEIRKKTIPIALTYGIQSLSLFGSYARNEADDNSDVDITTSNIKLKKPTRKGYVFKGWYSDVKCTVPIKNIPKGSTGNKKIYAKWVRNKTDLKSEKQ